MLDTNKLRKDVNRKIHLWNERRLFALAGIKNLSRSDMDSLLFFCDWYDAHGSLDMAIVNGNMAEILKRYGWEEE